MTFPWSARWQVDNRVEIAIDNRVGFLWDTHGDFSWLFIHKRVCSALYERVVALGIKDGDVTPDVLIAVLAVISNAELVARE